MRGLRTSVAVVFGVAAALAQDAPADPEVSCRVCHPGAVRGLARSPHASLLQRADLTGRTCAACHGDLAAHATAAGKRDLGTVVQPVAAASCKACHGDRAYPVTDGGHALRHVGSGAAPPPLPAADRIADLRQQAASATLDWSGLVEFGYRFVHHEGSRRAFRTDVDLEPGLRLRELELRGTGSEAAVVDDVSVRAYDVGDPRWGVDLNVDKADFVAIDGRFRRDSFVYDATGDFHRVDHGSRSTSTSIAVGGDALQLFATHTHRDEDGFWVTQRIGDRSLPVQTFVDGVASPRRLRSDEAELGLRGGTDELRWTIGGGFVDEHGVDRWAYSRTAVANPGFTESEDLTSSSRTDGPTARIGLSHDGDGLRWEVTGRYRDLGREIDANGTATGYDVAAFTTATTASGRTRGQLWIWQFDAGVALTDTVGLLLAGRYRDYEERHRLLQTDVQSTPSTGSTVTATTTRDDDTVQRLFDGDVQLEWRPVAELSAAAGYGMAREQLRVPRLSPADPQDFRRGTTRDDGLLASVTWRPGADWTVRAEGRDFASDGITLHELTPERSRLAGAAVDWQRDETRVSVFVRHRHNENEVSDHRLESLSTGLAFGLATGPVTWSGGYAYADTETRTRTSFYFDPDPSPVPTMVGFHGETHSWQLALTASPWERIAADIGAVVTRTTGTFALDTADLRAELRWSCLEAATAGVEYRHLSYDDAAGADNWAADLVFLFWSHRW